MLAPYGISAYESVGTDRQNFELALVGTAPSGNSMDINYRYSAPYEAVVSDIDTSVPVTARMNVTGKSQQHDDVIKWKHFPRYWPFVRGIHRSPVNPPHKGRWRGTSMSSLICVWTNGWVNKREAGDLRRHCAHYDATVMSFIFLNCIQAYIRHEYLTIHWAQIQYKYFILPV